MLKRKGQKAKELLENEAFKAACEELEREYFAQFKSTGLKEVEGRERLHIAVNVLADVKRKLGGFYSAAVYEAQKAE